MGVATRLVVVVVLAGAGFAVGYLVAPHHAGTPAKVVTTDAAAQHLSARTISIRAPTAAAAVPALAVSKPARKPAAHRAPQPSSSATTTQTRGPSAHTSASQSGSVLAGPQTHTAQPTQKTTTGKAKTHTTFNDGFTQQNPAPDSSTGSGSSTP